MVPYGILGALVFMTDFQHFRAEIVQNYKVFKNVQIAENYQS